MRTIASKPLPGPAEYFRMKLECEISPTGLKTLLAKTPDVVRILDVRDREEYDDGHIPGALGVSLEMLVSSLAALPRDRLIVVCGRDAACDLAARAALELAQKGFHVQNLTGGLAEWSRRGYPLEDSPRAAPSQAW